MATKTCKNCGWVLSATNKARRCPVCKKLINQGLCSKCGRYADTLNEGFYCDDCYTTLLRDTKARIYKKYVAKYTSTLEEWMDKIKRVPKGYKTLTEAQWLEACKHFNGCAFCGDETIDTRVYFIKFANGGRYCDWNILPACERCALSAKGVKNPFKTLAGANIYTTPVLNKVIEYLEVRLNAAIEGEGKFIDGTADST